MTTANSDSAATKTSSSNAFDGILALVAGVIVLLAVLDVGSEVYFSMRGEPETGRIVSAERAAARSHTVVAKVSVRPHGGAPTSVEIRDTLGRHGWKEGDPVDLLCAKIHADHLNCVADAWLDRYALSLIVIAIVIGLTALRLRVRRRERAAQRAEGRAGVASP